MGGQAEGLASLGGVAGLSHLRLMILVGLDCLMVERFGLGRYKIVAGSFFLCGAWALPDWEG